MLRPLRFPQEAHQKRPLGSTSCQDGLSWRKRSERGGGGNNGGTNPKKTNKTYLKCRVSMACNILRPVVKFFFPVSFRSTCMRAPCILVMKKPLDQTVGWLFLSKTRYQKSLLTHSQVTQPQKRKPLKTINRCYLRFFFSVFSLQKTPHKHSQRVTSKKSVVEWSLPS